MKTAAQGLPQTEEQDDNCQEAPAELNLRIKALESLLVEKGFVDPAGLDALIEAYKNKIGPRNGERAVAQPRVYSADKQRLSYFKAAAVHAAPVYLNRQATLNKGPGSAPFFSGRFLCLPWLKHSGPALERSSGKHLALRWKPV